MRVLEIQRDGEVQRIVTYLTQEEVERLDGIPPQAVVGVLAPAGSLQVNAVFREFLHEIIATAAPLDADLRRAAQAHGEGRLVYIDSRVPEDLQPVPEEDIIGWFQVRAGRIVEGSYLPNPRHSISGAHGFTAVLGGLRQAVVDALMVKESG
ncbi:MAG: hypothetical protein ACKV2U_10350 [Bryobacteraceae bacterium]